VIVTLVAVGVAVGGRLVAVGGTGVAVFVAVGCNGAAVSVGAGVSVFGAAGARVSVGVAVSGAGGSSVSVGVAVSSPATEVGRGVEVAGGRGAHPANNNSAARAARTNREKIFRFMVAFRSLQSFADRDLSTLRLL
jgi:hypothetical protein